MWKICPLSDGLDRDCHLYIMTQSASAFWEKEKTERKRGWRGSKNWRKRKERENLCSLFVFAPVLMFFLRKRKTRGRVGTWKNEESENKFKATTGGVPLRFLSKKTGFGGFTLTGFTHSTTLPSVTKWLHSDCANNFPTMTQGFGWLHSD